MKSSNDRGIPILGYSIMVYNKTKEECAKMHKQHGYRVNTAGEPNTLHTLIGSCVSLKVCEQVLRLVEFERSSAKRVYETEQDIAAFIRRLEVLNMVEQAAKNHEQILRGETD